MRPFELNVDCWTLILHEFPAGQEKKGGVFTISLLASPPPVSIIYPWHYSVEVFLHHDDANEGEKQCLTEQESLSPVPVVSSAIIWSHT